MLKLETKKCKVTKLLNKEYVLFEVSNSQDLSPTDILSYKTNNYEIKEVFHFSDYIGIIGKLISTHEYKKSDPKDPVIEENYAICPSCSYRKIYDKVDKCPRCDQKLIWRY